MKKKTLALVMTAAMAFSALTGCGSIRTGKRSSGVGGVHSITERERGRRKRLWCRCFRNRSP